MTGGGDSGGGGSRIASVVGQSVMFKNKKVVREVCLLKVADLSCE